MATVARLESTLGFKDAEFTAGIARAERRAETFGARASRSLTKAFARDPAQRAENALVGLTTSMATGNIASGVAAFANSITALPLFIGAAVGAGAVLFGKLQDHIKETTKAGEELQATLSQPISLVVASGGADKFIADLSAQADTLRTKYASTTQSIVDAFKSIPSLFVRGQSTAEDEEGLRRRREIAEAEAAITEAAQKRGRAELVQGRVLRGLEDDPRRRARAELAFKFEKREAELRAHPDKGTEARLQNLKEEWNAELKKFNAEKTSGTELEKLEQRRFETAKKLINLEQSSLPDETKKRLRAQMSLGDVNEELKNPNLKAGDRRKLELEKFQQESVLRGAKAKNPYAWGTIANQEWEDKNGGFGSVALREAETKDPTKWGSLAWSAAQRGETPMPDASNMSPDIHEELVKLNNNFDKYWGPN